MNTQFDKCLKIILTHEGGFSDHPDDPGGVTMMGVTQETMELWKGKKVTYEDMKRLTLADVAPIYKARYWDRLSCDLLPCGIDLAVFDFGVNAGIGRAAKFLQKIVGAKQDGAIGRLSIEAVRQYVEQWSCRQFVETYQHERQDYYESLRNFEVFGRGWTRRNKETTDAAIQMCASPKR